MPPLPPEMVALLRTFAPAFGRPTFARALVLLCGTLLASGRRTVAALRATGRADDPRFGTYHRVLSRARWSPLALGRLVVGRLLPADQPVVLLVDETLERRRGKRIAYRGRFRDAVRARGPHVVTCEGVQWLVLAVLVPPALGTPRPDGPRAQPGDERDAGAAAPHLHPGRELVLVADGAFAAVHLGHACRRAGITFVTRCRMDVALYGPPTPRPAGTRGRKPAKGPRQPTLKDHLAAVATTWARHAVTWYGGEPAEVDLASGAALRHRAGQPPLPVRWVLVRDPAGGRKPFALCCTDPGACPLQALAYYLGRWNVEVTFEELRAWLGAETQRGWCLLTTQRATPCLFGLFSIVALSAQALHPGQLPAPAAAWYPKAEPTFADARAAVRRALWAAATTRTQPHGPDSTLFPGDFLASLVEAAAYAA